jgi:hypothetical protein
MKIKEIISEAPLPPDWDHSEMGKNTSFKSRLSYALERAKRLGTGSSRVATIIEYEGRPTVLKIAKNRKGIAQNLAEMDILNDGYVINNIDIVIPFIDADFENYHWIQTEMAKPIKTKNDEAQLLSLLHVPGLHHLISYCHALHGTNRNIYGTAQHQEQKLRNLGVTDENIEKIANVASQIVDLKSSFNVLLTDLGTPRNWGIFNNKPVIIDVGFTDAVQPMYF